MIAAAHRALRRTLSAAGLVGVLGACGGEPAPAPAGSAGDAAPPRNVLLIVVDTLRADHLGCYGAGRDTSPRVDALAAAGVRFERAYSVSSWTMPSVASVLTGLYPAGHGVSDPRHALPAAAETLAERFAAAGYATGGVVSHKLVGHDHAYDQGFERFDESEAQGHNHVSTPGVTARAQEWLGEWAADERPFFLFVHLFDPHYNYRPHDQADFAAPSAGRLDGRQSIKRLRQLADELSPEERGFLTDLYDEEVAFTDAGIGALLDELERLGLADDTLVAVTADHGEEFLERGWLGHVRTLYDELVRVPLVVHAPGGLAGRVVDTPVSVVSLAPTLLELAGLPVDPTGFQAPSLAGALTTGAAPAVEPLVLAVDFEPIQASAAVKRAHKQGLVQGDWKLVQDTDSGTLELYDLAADPAERDDRAAHEPERLRALRATLERRLADLSRTRLDQDDAVDLDAERLEQLRALGYVGDEADPEDH